MPAFICNTCGTQYAPSEKPPSACPICDDERQYVTPAGQSWTTLDVLGKRCMNAIRELEPGLISITTQPAFGIGQRAQLLRTPHGNILWDCIALIDRATIEMINAMGGIKGIAISHPHYYTTMVEWSMVFGDAPIHLHTADRQWVMRPHPSVRHWTGETHELRPGATLIRCGGHFAGGTVMHVAREASGNGALFAGDVIAVNMDRASVTFMYSYPNYIPLSASSVRHIANTMAPWSFDKIFGAFARRNIMNDGREVFERSVARYLEAIGA